MYNDGLNQKITQALQHQAGNLELSAAAEKRIFLQIQNLNQKERPVMKKTKFFNTKVVITLMAMICLTFGTALAYGGITNWMGQSDPATEVEGYQEMLEQTLPQLDFQPATVPQLDQGFKFLRGIIDLPYPVYEGGQAGNTAYQVLSITYLKEDTGELLFYHADRLPEDQGNPAQNQVVKQYGNTAMTYTEQTYRYIPANYEMTPEDEKAKEEGSVLFVETDGDVRDDTVKSVSWQINGVHYSLSAHNSTLAPENLFAMARTIIDAA